MHRALTLAKHGQGNVEPNPMVGAVIAQGNRIIAEGYHKNFGGPHAEIHALRAAAKNAKNVRGTTLYVTLEPCCHVGKTPPCTDAILATGITRVVIAMTDPFFKINPSRDRKGATGAAILRNHGLTVDIGLLDPEARDLNAPFITRLTRHRPFIIAKWAQSLDGRVALPPLPGSSTPRPVWISSEISRATVHKLRARMDAILVGINTALIDNPLLTVRLADPRSRRRTPTRIILDSHCRLPLTSNLIQTISEAPVLIAHARTLTFAAKRRLEKLTAKGAMSLPLPTDKQNRPQLKPLLAHLAANDYTNLLLEGGPSLLASFLHQNLIDEAHIFLAPLLIGDPAPTALATPTILPSGNRKTKKLRLISSTHSGPDLHLILRPER